MTLNRVICVAQVLEIESESLLFIHFEYNCVVMFPSLLGLSPGVHIHIEPTKQVLVVEVLLIQIVVVNVLAFLDRRTYANILAIDKSWTEPVHV
jgi:hypothetical protein